MLCNRHNKPVMDRCALNSAALTLTVWCAGWTHCIGTMAWRRNEVIAYIGLGAHKATLAPRSFTIATFALCGFANLGSIGMQVGGIGALVPERRNDLARLGVRAMLAGTMANLISASIAGMFLG